MNILVANGTFLAIAVLGCSVLAYTHTTTTPKPKPYVTTVLSVAPIDLSARGDIPATPEDHDTSGLGITEDGYDPRLPVPVNPEDSQPDRYISKVYVGPSGRNKPYGWEHEEHAESIFSDYQLNPGLARTMLRLESQTGRLMLSSTGCQGWYQFCSAMAKHYGVSDPLNLVQSSHGAAKLAKDNTRSLEIYKVPPTNFHLYLSHMVSPKNTQNLYKAVVLNKSLSQRMIKKTYKELQSNWWVDSLGEQTGDYRTDFKTFYRYFNGKYAKVSDPSFEY